MEDLDKKIKTYQPPLKVKNVLDKGKTVFLVGVAGAGKDTILNSLLKNSDYNLIISHTTRAPRANHGVMEVNGREYHFIDLAKAEQMVDNSEFVEVKLVHGRVYGTSVAELEKAHEQGHIAIADIEVQGVSEYCSLSNKVTPIFILPPNFAEWMIRLKKRYGDQLDKMDMLVRLNTARTELQDAINKEYFEFVVNDQLDIAIKIANEIAHGSKSESKNAIAKQRATKLLEDLNQFLDNN